MLAAIRKLDLTHRSISSLDFGSVAVWGEGLRYRSSRWVRPCSQRSRLRPKPALWVHWVHRCRYAAVATGRFTTILQWQRKKDCYFEPLFILARGLSLIALALSLVALSLVALTLALTLVALTPAKSVALIAAISVIPLIYASSSLLLSRSLLSRSLLGRSLLGAACWAASCCEAMLLAVVMERAACPACVVMV